MDTFKHNEQVVQTSMFSICVQLFGLLNFELYNVEG